jgi:hypothetical protein
LRREWRCGIDSGWFFFLYRFEFYSLLKIESACIMGGTMFRAEIEPMPSNPPDRLPYTGLYKVVIYEGERFVRTDKENMIHAVAKRLAEELNYQFTGKRKARGARA